MKSRKAPDFSKMMFTAPLISSHLYLQTLSTDDKSGARAVLGDHILRIPTKAPPLSGKKTRSFYRTVAKLRPSGWIYDYAVCGVSPICLISCSIDAAITTPRSGLTHKAIPTPHSATPSKITTLDAGVRMHPIV